MLQRVAVSLAMLAAVIFALQFLPEAADGADKCPSITVTGVSGDNPTALFSANVTSMIGDLTYNWAVSSGAIDAGQGTLQIHVVDVAGDRVTASLEVGGIAASCPNSASETVTL
jgi:hypothetical protein